MRKIAMKAGSCMACLALASLSGCTGHDSYETYYIDGGNTGALANSAAAGANAGAGSDRQAGAKAGSSGQAGANGQAGASAFSGDGGTADGSGGAAGDVGAAGGGDGGTADGSGGAASSGTSGQAGSPAGGEAGGPGAAKCIRSSDCPTGMWCSAADQCVSEPCTDTNCGGACSPCGNGKKCRADTDCASYACDAALHTCTADQCQDHQQDGLETDTDCGGGLCATCALGKSCLVSSDCASQACDGVALVCVSDVCADHRKDGFETDVDCGGGSCAWCTVGKKCGSSFDCVAGHVCNTVKVCQ